jgi:(E)-2-((N-methylformamido)methylene)succinate hydrolase
MPDPTVIFVHGSPGSAAIFERVCALLPAQQRVLRRDLPDHGDADDQLDLSLTSFDAVVDEWLYEVAGPVVLVGYSFGALLAARALSRVAAAQVQRAILIAGFARLSADLARRNTGLADMVRTRALSPGSAAELALGLWFGASELPTSVHSLAVDVIRTDTPERLARQLDRSARLDADGVEPRPFLVPSVILHGEADATIAPDLGRGLANLAARGRYELVANAPHALPLSNPELVATRIIHAWTDSSTD